AELRKRSRIVICVRIALKLGEKPIVIPHIAVAELPEHINVANQCGGVAESNRDDNATLCVEFTGLSKVVHAIEKTKFGGMRRRRGAKLCLDLEPHRHRVY